MEREKLLAANVQVEKHCVDMKKKHAKILDKDKKNKVILEHLSAKFH